MQIVVWGKIDNWETGIQDLSKMSFELFTFPHHGKD